MLFWNYSNVKFYSLGYVEFCSLSHSHKYCNMFAKVNSLFFHNDTYQPKIIVNPIKLFVFYFTMLCKIAQVLHWRLTYSNKIYGNIPTTDVYKSCFKMLTIATGNKTWLWTNFSKKLCLDSSIYRGTLYLF